MDEISANPSSSYSYSLSRRSVDHHQVENDYIAARNKDLTNSLLSNSNKVQACLSFFPICLKELSTSALEKSQFFYGCCLIADISGFTLLSSTLCAKGLDGIDELRLFIDNSFATLVQLVYQYGGEVIAFAGDALLCVFPSADESAKPHACSQAIKCGLQMLKCSIQDTRIHVAISYGKMCFAILGGHNGKYDFLVNGECVDIVGEGLAKAHEQECIVTTDVYRTVESEFTGVALAIVEEEAEYVLITGRKLNSLGWYDSNTPKTNFNWQSIGGSPCVTSEACTVEGSLENHDDDDKVSTSEKVILGCVPLPVLRAIASDTLSDLAEIRTVTTLFLRLDSYCTREMVMVSDMQPFFLAMQRCLDECGGMLRQFLIDDKGCVLIGLWGVPTATHAANCTKALRCAVLMRNDARKLMCSTSIGLATGSVFCGVVGPQYRREYVAIGKSVNLSARLMAKANGRILMDSETFDRLPLEIASRTCLTESILMKGIPNSTQYHCYASNTPPPGYAHDVQADSRVVIESYIRRVLHALDEKKTSSGISDGSWEVARIDEYRSKNVPCFEHAEAAFINEPSVVPPTPTNVLVITGSPGSGKTAAANYIIRRYSNRFTSIKSPTSRNTTSCAVFVRLTDMDDSLYSALRKIVNAVYIFYGHDDYASQKEFLKQTISTLSSPENTISMFSVIKQALQLDWEWNDNTTDARFGYSDMIVYDVMPLLLTHMFGEVIKILCLDDAHNMCSGTWEIVTRLSINWPSAFVVLTLRAKNSLSTFSDDLQLNTLQLVKGKGDISPSERGSTRSYTSKMDQRNERIVPVRHVADYLMMCQSIPSRCLLKLHMKPLAFPTVQKILQNELNKDVSQETVVNIRHISHGNPFMLWKLISYFKQCHGSDIEETVSRSKDNALIAFLMENLSPSDCVVLRTASVIGEHFPLPVLQYVLDQYSYSKLYSSLEYLAESGLLIILDSGVYSFASTLIRVFVYNLVPKSDAEILHAKIAEAIKKSCSLDWSHYSVR